MSENLSLASIVREVSAQASQRIVRKVIAHLQSMKEGLQSGDDSGLKTVWDEICVQIQHEESFFWDAYDQTVKSIVSTFVSEIPAYEQEALWLQTNAGWDWDCVEPETREAYPVCEDDIVQYITSQIYAKADDWSNARVRDYLERARDMSG